MNRVVVKQVIHLAGARSIGNEIEPIPGLISGVNYAVGRIDFTEYYVLIVAQKTLIEQRASRSGETIINGDIHAIRGSDPEAGMEKSTSTESRRSTVALTGKSGSKFTRK